MFNTHHADLPDPAVLEVPGDSVPLLSGVVLVPISSLVCAAGGLGVAVSERLGSVIGPGVCK